MLEVTGEILERLSAPFLAHVRQLYFTRHVDRVYVGKTPADKLSGSDAAPVNFALEVSDINASSLAVMAKRLNDLENARVPPAS